MPYYFCNVQLPESMEEEIVREHGTNFNYNHIVAWLLKREIARMTAQEITAAIEVDERKVCDDCTCGKANGCGS